MPFNFTGLIAALSTFAGVWFGHVAVRWIEFRVGNIHIPAAVFFTAGLALEVVSMHLPDPPASAGFGILGVTCLWDALEFFRQERRIKLGHAPANARNPRHARILNQYPSATRIDWLDRQPVGGTLTAEEIRRIEEAQG
jgi:hypothetical protein